MHLKKYELITCRYSFLKKYIHIQLTLSTGGLIFLKLKHFTLYISLIFYINCFLVFSPCMRGNVGQKLQNEPKLPHTFVGFNCDANDKKH